MYVDIEWDSLGGLKSDDGWNYHRCLYAYVSDDDDIVYIGLAWDATVDERFRGKRAMCGYLESEGIYDCLTLLGEVQVPGGRLTRQLLADVESLLIHTEQPCANIQAIQSRTSRPGLVVQCHGDWPGQQRNYYDT